MTVAPKKKKPVEKPTPSALAFREYERVSYYLATQGDFNFDLDDEAREAFFDGEKVAEIKLMTANRIAPDEEHDGRKIPKGDHIDGLAVRTAERERVKGKKAEKQATVKSSKEKPLDMTPNMRKLAKKRGLKADVGESLA